MRSAIPGCDVRDRAVTVLVPNAFLPVQYSDRVRRWKSLTGEHRLMLAVLEQAVDEYLRHCRAVECRRRRLFAQTAAWFESADRSRLYCFANVCDHLGLDAEYLRRGLRRWRVEGRPASLPRRVAVTDWAATAETAVA